jgi:N6-adenosine-specific RNA methylase IME4
MRQSILIGVCPAIKNIAHESHICLHAWRYRKTSHMEWRSCKRQGPALRNQQDGRHSETQRYEHLREAKRGAPQRSRARSRSRRDHQQSHRSDAGGIRAQAQRRLRDVDVCASRSISRASTRQTSRARTHANSRSAELARSLQRAVVCGAHATGQCTFDHR